MDENSIEYLSGVCTKIECLCNEKPHSLGSGFFYRHSHGSYLVTAWHVLAGRCATCGQPSHSSCFTPDQIRLNYLVKVDNTGIFEHQVQFSICGSDGTSNWLQHPAHAQDVDVAAIRFPSNTALAPPPAFEVTNEINQTKLLVRPGDDVFVLGYPRGISKQGVLPIWKRASIASEPEFQVAGQDILLVDTATREGMSGSPVIAVQRGLGRFPGNSVAVGDFIRVMGVYSGRYGSEDELAVQLGICWKSKLIDEIIEGNVVGKEQLRPVENCICKIK